MFDFDRNSRPACRSISRSDVTLVKFKSHQDSISVDFKTERLRSKYKFNQFIIRKELRRIPVITFMKHNLFTHLSTRAVKFVSAFRDDVSIDDRYALSRSDFSREIFLFDFSGSRGIKIEDFLGAKRAKRREEGKHVKSGE